MKGRVTALTVIILLAFGLILGQAVLVQVHRAAALNADPNNPRNTAAGTYFPRGEILSSNGTVLARSIPTSDAAHPWRRAYPLGSLTSDVVGYSSSYYGTGGAEYQYDTYLLSHAQPPRSISQVLSPVRSSDTLHLTLEIALQQVASRELAGRDGAVVALDPRDGSVLAMYSNPGYSPAPLASTNVSIQKTAWKEYITKNANGFPPLGNVATQETFPPGSTSKVVTTAAVFRYWPGLSLKSYPSVSFINLPQSNVPLYNSGGGACGGTIYEMLPPSCDPGFASVGLDLGGTRLANQANQFGYNSTPPLDLPGVVPSFFDSANALIDDPPFLAYAAIGQGNVRATALQDALIAAGIANQGKVVGPHVMASITDSLGNTVAKWHPAVWRRPLGPVQDAQIVPMMQNVVKYGTAAGIFLPQDDVAAKTGTAQAAANTKTDDWMIAFAPATHPLIAVAVVVPFQTLAGWGATVAGPIVKCMIEAQLAIDSGQPPANTATTCPA